MSARRRFMQRSAQLITSIAAWSAVDSQAQLDPAALVATIQVRLNSSAVLRGHFEQRKKLRGFKRPVISRGSFMLARDLGMVWRTETPFAATLTMTRAGLRAAFEPGSEPIEVQQDPGFGAVSATLLALLAGDLTVLMRNFRIDDGAADKHDWHLKLRAEDAVLARVFQRVELRGSRYVDAVRLVETSGDESTLLFSAHNASTLTSEERILFQ